MAWQRRLRFPAPHAADFIALWSDLSSVRQMTPKTANRARRRSAASDARRDMPLAYTANDTPTKTVNLTDPEKAQAVTRNATISQETSIDFIPRIP